MFHVTWTPARSEGSGGVAQDDSFAPSIDHILKEMFQMRGISTFFLSCKLNIFLFSNPKSFLYTKQIAFLEEKVKRRREHIPSILNRSS